MQEAVLNVSNQQDNAQPLKLPNDPDVIRVIVRSQHIGDVPNPQACRFDCFEKLRQCARPIRVDQQPALRAGDVKGVCIAVKGIQIKLN